MDKFAIRFYLISLVAKQLMGALCRNSQVDSEVLVQAMHAALNKPDVDDTQSISPASVPPSAARKKRRRSEGEEETPASKRPTVTSGATLQSRVDDALSHRMSCPKLLRTLMCDLLAAGEVPGFVQVHDTAKEIGVAPGKVVRKAMEKEHRKGKPGPARKQRPQLQLPPREKRAMEPFRRLHKMCMGKKRGKKLAQRNALATDDAVQRVCAWLKEPEKQNKRAKALIERKAWRSKNGRRKLADQITQMLGKGTKMQAALGVITKLKRKKILD